MKNEQAVFDFHGTAGGYAPGNNAQQKPVKLRLSYISLPPASQTPPPWLPCLAEETPLPKALVERIQ
jgi:hypothetical protein